MNINRRKAKAFTVGAIKGISTPSRSWVIFLVTTAIVYVFNLQHRVPGPSLDPLKVIRPTVTFEAIGKYGRLGNQFFQVAATIGIALSKDMDYDFPPYISGTDIGMLCNLTGKLPIASLEDAFYVSEDSYNLLHKQNLKLPGHKSGIVSLFGYFQSFEYFQDYQESLKEYLKINHDILIYVEQEVPEVTFENSVAMHVRRGDYLHIENTYSLPTKDYYKEALSQFPEDIVVIVASDDISWCKSNFDNMPQKFVFSPFKEAFYDFTLLARSKNLIMANSSFSWWAAYFKMLHFGNGSVTAPMPWYTLKGPLAHLNLDTLYLPHWKILQI